MNRLFYGDNLDVLREHVPDESVDLVYLDPPFNSNASYNVLFGEQDGTRAAAQIRAFEDTWGWDQAAVRAFKETVEMGGEVANALSAFRTLLGESNMLAYLSMMAPRLLELHRVLSPTGSLFLHCDTTASHYLKLLLDATFSPRQFENEIIWRRTGSNSALKRFGPIHQSIFFYTKTQDAPFYPQAGPYSRAYVDDQFRYDDDRGRYRPAPLTGPGTREGDSGKPWRHYNPTDKGRHWQPSSYVYDKYRELTGENLADYDLIERLERLDEEGLIYWGSKGQGAPNYKLYLNDAPGVYYQDIWAFVPGTEGCVYERSEGIDEDVKWLSSQDKERLGYPTQKPEGLLNRIIRATTKEGDVVLDPFCGCGTTVVSAHRLKRRWIGIDITHLAVGLMKHRLKDTFGDAVEDTYEVRGEPVDVESARALALHDRYQFEWWALGLVGARRNEKKGADSGIDGRLNFFDIGTDTKMAVFQVKSGKLKPDEVRGFGRVIEREGAQIGVMLTLDAPSQAMRAEAADLGTYESPWKHHPRYQILTIQEILDGARVDMPPAGTSTTYKRAERYAEPMNQLTIDASSRSGSEVTRPADE